MAINGNNISIDNTVDNTSTNVIQITEDKLKNILSKHITKIEKSKDWVGAGGLVVALAGMFFTSEFKTTLGMSADMLRGFFLCLFVISILYLIHVVCNCIKNRSDVDKIIRDIKNES